MIHYTSPSHQLNPICNNNNNNNNISNNNINIFRNGLHNENDNDIFDDSIDGLDDWPSPMRLARSRSWFCCANEKNDRLEQPSIRSRPISCRYSIVRAEPKSQSQIVRV